MTEVSLVADKLVLTVKGLDVILAFKHHLEIPLTHIVRVELGVAAEAKERLSESLRLPGAHLPGIITAGSYREHGRWMFWDIHSGASAITIWLRHERYDAIVVDVEDPSAAVDKINWRLRP
ncbi:MAG TPA: hypothetical protein VGL86_14085 [Polyangia bacterium]|jgi:hypothetical protein